MIKKILFCSALLSTLLVISCGGGGGGSSSANVTIGGTGGKGLMGGATVSAYAVNSDGSVSTTALGTTTSSSSASNFGAYSLSIPPTSQPVIVQMTANSNTTMLDETNIVGGVQQQVAAPAGMMLRSFVSSATSNNSSVSINPFTEMAVNSIPAGSISANSLQQAAFVVKSSVLGGSVDPVSTIIPAGTSAPATTDSKSTPAQLALFSVNSQVAQLAKTGACSTTNTSVGDQFKCVVSDPTNGLNSTLSVNGSTATINSPSILNALQATSLPAAVVQAVGSNAVTLPTITASSPGGKTTITVPSTAQISTYASADTFAKNLSTSTKSYASFLTSFGNAGKSLVHLSDINLRMFRYLITSVNTLCSASQCVVGTSIPYTTNYGGGYTYNFDNDPIGAGYSVSLAQGTQSGAYNYTIINNTNSSTYTGTVSYSNSSTSGASINFNGTVPNLVQVNGSNTILVQPTSVQFTLSASTLSHTINTSVNGTVSFSASAPAVSGLPAFSFSLSNGIASGEFLTGSPSYVYAVSCASSSTSPSSSLTNSSCTNQITTVYKPYDVAPTSISGTICLSQGDTSCSTPGTAGTANTFNGSIQATGGYSQPPITPTASASATTRNILYPETATLSGTVTLSNGDTATGSIALTTDYSKVNTTQAQSSSNYGSGGIRVDLTGYDSNKTNFTEIVLIDQRTSYTNAALSAQVFTTSDKSNWIELTGSYTIDPTLCGTYQWVCFKPSKQSGSVNDSIVITSSGNYGGTYSINGKSATITDASGNTVGAIKNNQLYIDGGVTLVYFASTPQ